MLNKIRNIFKNNTGKEIAETLDSLGYFKYSIPEEIEILKSEISETYEEYGMLSTIYTYENGKHFPKDYRLYSLDNENLFMEGGFERYFLEIEPTLEKLNISLNVYDEKESFSQTKGLNHSISINGTRYEIFKDFSNYSRGGGTAAKRFVEILNYILARHNSDERVYPIGRGHNGQLIFLTNKQFRYITSVYPDTQRKPLKVKEWARRYDVK